MSHKCITDLASSSSLVLLLLIFVSQLLKLLWLLYPILQYLTILFLFCFWAVLLWIKHMDLFSQKTRGEALEVGVLIHSNRNENKMYCEVRRKFCEGMQKYFEGATKILLGNAKVVLKYSHYDPWALLAFVVLLTRGSLLCNVVLCGDKPRNPGQRTEVETATRSVEKCCVWKTHWILQQGMAAIFTALISFLGWFVERVQLHILKGTAKSAVLLFWSFADVTSI